MVDELATWLTSKSNLTGAQAETIALRKRILAGQLKTIEATELRTGGPVRIGSFYRVLDQAKNNVQRSIFSILLAIRLGVLRPDELVRLFTQVSLPGEIDKETASEIMGVLDVLVRRLVML